MAQINNKIHNNSMFAVFMAQENNYKREEEEIVSRRWRTAEMTPNSPNGTGIRAHGQLLCRPIRICRPNLAHLLFLLFSLLFASSPQPTAALAIADDILRALPVAVVVDPEGRRQPMPREAVELRFIDEKPEEEAEASRESAEADTKSEDDVHEMVQSGAIWWYLLAGMSDKTRAQSLTVESPSLKLLQRQRVVNVLEEAGNSEEELTEKKQHRREENAVKLLVKKPAKKAPVRRCGTLLIKHIQTVCNGCLRSASDADPIMMSKRGKAADSSSSNAWQEARNRWKRGGGFGKITDMCCTQRACGDEELKPFCC